MRGRVAAAGVVLVVGLVAACSSSGTSPASNTPPASSSAGPASSSAGPASSSAAPASSSAAPASTTVASAAPTASSAPALTVSGVDIAATATAAAFDGDGDLWPNCWAADGEIYTAHGDGKGFGTEFADIGTDVIHGEPGDLTGDTTAIGDQVGQVWSGDGYTRKPTGIACVGDTLYLAVQDLATDFNDAPAASISTSTDHGRSWTWDRSAPMFSDGRFTTIFFLDYGRGYAGAPDGFVYAYGLDHNWRDSYSDVVPDPLDLYLARVPKDRVVERAAWQFYAGGSASAPRWSQDIGQRKPVLHDARRVVTQPGGAAPGLSVLSQGGVVYDAPLRTYLYTSWTEHSFQIYTAPQPWGPWKLLGGKDFGPYPWNETAYGGYATTIPSKFISDDGRSMWMQSNVCPCANAGISVYYFSLRKITLRTTREGTGGQ